MMELIDRKALKNDGHIHIHTADGRDYYEVDHAPTIDAVELPCKIGDKVWIARRYKCHKRPRWGIVSEMFFTDDMELCIVVKGIARGKWGVDVFATYEEAEKQIEINNRKD